MFFFFIKSLRKIPGYQKKYLVAQWATGKKINLLDTEWHFKRWSEGVGIGGGASVTRKQRMCHLFLLKFKIFLFWMANCWTYQKAANAYYVSVININVVKVYLTSFWQLMHNSFSLIVYINCFFHPFCLIITLTAWLVRYFPWRSSR